LTSSLTGAETAQSQVDVTTLSTTEEPGSVSPARASSAAGLLLKPDLNICNIQHCKITLFSTTLITSWQKETGKLTY